MKECLRCKRTKPLTEFQNVKNKYSDVCIICYGILRDEKLRSLNYIIKKNVDKYFKYCKLNNITPKNKKSHYCGIIKDIKKLIDIYDFWAESEYNKENKPIINILNYYSDLTVNDIEITTKNEQFLKNKRICSKCGKIVDIEDFTKNKNTKSGFSSNCKACNRTSSSEYENTKMGLITRIYNNQKNISELDYDKKQLSEYLLTNAEFNDLYKIWADSKFKTDKKPSVIRIDKTLNFSLNNIKIISSKYKPKINKKPKKLIKKSMDGRGKKFKKIAECKK